MNTLHLFLPHQFHHRKSHFLQYYSFFSYAILSLVISAGIVSFKQQKPDVLAYATHMSVTDLVKFTNDERIKNGAPPVVFNDKLAAAALRKGQDMFAKNYWAHFGPNGESPWNFIVQAGYTYTAAGENLARDFDDSKGVVDAWMASKMGHRENLLNKQYQDMGIAVVNGTLLGHETTLVVQEFGKPYNALAQLPSTQNAASIDLSKPSPSATATARAALKPLATASATPVAIAQTQPSQPPIVPSVEVSTPVNKTSLASAFLGVSQNRAFSLFKVIALSLMIFVGMLLAIDTIVIRKRGVYRFTTHSAAHFSVLIVITLVVVAIGSGKIL